MKRGISTNLDVSTCADALKQNGIDFVFRYYSQTTSQPQKRLTSAEAEALSAAGLTIGVVYEDNPISTSYFSSSRGYQDGVNAFSAALALHQPTGSAIYFAVDYDAPLIDISGSILDYFNGVNRGITGASQGGPAYLMGVYGSGATCNFIKAQCPFVSFSWLAASAAWIGSGSYNEWDVNQTLADSPLCGLNADEYEENQAQDNFGGFTLGYV